jgi:hypothetical protein
MMEQVGLELLQELIWFWFGAWAFVKGAIVTKEYPSLECSGAELECNGDEILENALMAENLPLGSIVD